MRQVVWQEVSELIKKSNFPLWKLISDINPGSELPLFLAKYHYGDLLVNEGVVQFPLQKDLLVTFQNLPAEIKKFFDCTSLPMGLILNKVVEVFSHHEDKVISLNIMKAGRLLGLGSLLAPRLFDFTQVSVSAGVRTTFILPNVSDVTHHKKLANIYHAPQTIRSLFDHWSVFHKISNYRYQNRYWGCEVLFFSANWLDKIKQANTVPWLSLKNYLYEHVCLQKGGMFNLFNNIYLENYLLKMLSKYRVYLSDYAFDTLKYIFLMQQGYAPGYQVSSGDEEYLPESMIQEAYVQDYKLKTYLPIIMHSAMWEDQNRRDPLYYSLNLPFVFGLTTPDMKNLRRTDLLQQIHFVIEKLELTKYYRYRYIHYHTNAEQNIEKAPPVFADDPRVIQLKDRYPGREISSSNTFVRGSIQLQEI